MDKKEFIDKILNVMCEAHEQEELENGENIEDIKVRTKRFKTIMENARLEEELGKYTHNSYIGITKIMIEHYEKENELLKETAEKCKKYLDDNSLPYREEDKEDEE